MEVAQLANRLRTYERNVAGEHQYMIEILQRWARNHHGVPCATLLRLKHKVHAGMLHRRAYLVCFMPNDGEDIACRYHLRGRTDHMFQQRTPANLMQHLR